MPALATSLSDGVVFGNQEELRRLKSAEIARGYLRGICGCKVKFSEVGKGSLVSCGKRVLPT